MKKLNLLLVSLLFTSVVFSQIPTGYYDDASGKTGKALLVALHDIIDGHTDHGYNALKNGYKSTDKKPNGNVWDIYSDVPGGTPPYEFQFSNTCGTYQSEGDCYNREHTFPQSWFNKQSPMRSDIIQVLPTDGKVNGMRSNFPYGEVDNPSKTTLNGSKLGANSTSGYSGTAFEPIDAYKGDLARIYFYMAARYNNKIAGWQHNGTADNVLAGNNYPVYDDWQLQLLLKWNSEDPVSQKEIDRNNACYDYQGNRNPFVDHPEYVCAVWGGDCDTTSTPNDTTNNEPSNQVTMSMSTSDYQIIVDYVNDNLSNGSEHSDNTEDYYGASAHYENFDTRDGSYNSKFVNADSAIVEALREVLLPAKYPTSKLNVNYVVSYATYNGASGSGSKSFYCCSESPLAFKLGQATDEPNDTTNNEPGDKLPSELNLTFDSDLDGCTLVQVSGTTGWSQTTYKTNSYAVINTYGQGANESWLVTPAVNMNAIENASFSFDMTSYNASKTVSACGAGQFEVYYSTVSFDGSTINTDNWQRFTSVDNETLSEKWDWITVNVDVNSIVGDAVCFAFVHSCGSSDGTTWEIDNVKLSGDVVAELPSVNSPQLCIYPNPAKDAFYLSASVDQLVVISLSGQVLKVQNDVKAQDEIYIASLKSGIYLIKTLSGSESQVLRLIVE